MENQGMPKFQTCILAKITGNKQFAGVLPSAGDNNLLSKPEHIVESRKSSIANMKHHSFQQLNN